LLTGFGILEFDSNGQNSIMYPLTDTFLIPSPGQLT
jgi:hypothetical protein